MIVKKDTPTQAEIKEMFSENINYESQDNLAINIPYGKKSKKKMNSRDLLNDQAKEEDIHRISTIVDKDKKIIVEQIYDEKNGCRFCIYNHNDGSIKYDNEYIHNKVTYKPLIGEEIKKKAVLLPSEAIDYMNNGILDNEIISFVKKWLDIPEDFAQFGIWNIKVSCVYENFHTLNYLRFQGDTGCGKTRGLDVFGHLHYKPIFVTGGTTPAPLFRVIDKWRGSIIMDEADLKKSDESEDIIKILNNGFEKGKHIMRCDQNDATKLLFFDPFCPKMLSTRRSFTDKATESRCITHIMDVTERKDIPLNLNDEFFEKALDLRNKLLMWRFKNFFEIKNDVEFDLGDIEPRVKQIVGSYISLFSTDLEQMEKFKKYITEYQEELIEERASSFEGAIVEAIHNLLDKGVVDFDNKDIIEEGSFTGRDGKAMKPQGISGILKSLGLKKMDSSRINGKIKRPIIIKEKSINKIFKRYGLKCYNVTTVTTRMETPQVVTSGSKLEKTEDVTTPRGLHRGCNTCNVVTTKLDEYGDNNDN